MIRQRIEPLQPAQLLRSEMNSENNAEKKVRIFLESLLEEYGESTDFENDDSLVISGLLDSLAILKIVVFLEEEFAIDFSQRGFDQNQFDTLKSILSFIE